MSTELLEKYFTPNLQITSFDFRANKDQSAQFKRVEAGKVRLPSGRLVATDGFDPGVVPFVETAPCGQFPVEVFLGCLLKDVRPAASRIRFKNEAAVRWEPAQFDWGEDRPPFDDPFRMGVDSGTWCYMDKDLIDCHGEELRAALEKAEDAAEENDYQLPPEGVMVNLEAGNTILFSSGTGDGFYASYWGFNEKNERVELVTDFGLLLLKNDKIVIANDWLIVAKSVI